MTFWVAMFFNVGYLATVTALVLTMVYAFGRSEKWVHRAHRSLVVGLVFLGLSLVLGLWAEAHRPGHMSYAFWGQWFTSLTLFAFLIGVVFMAVQRRALVSLLGLFVLPVPVFLLSLALTQAFLASPRCPFASVEDFLRVVDVSRRLPEVPVTFWTVWHVPLIFLSYAAFANAFGVGIAYLIGERQIKNHHPDVWTYRLPALDDMDRLISRLILLAFPALTVGLSLGAGTARLAGGLGWASDPKVLWSLVLWLIYLLYLALRYVAGWRGRRTAYLSLIGFVVVLVTYAGVSFFSKAHGFLSGMAR